MSNKLGHIHNNGGAVAFFAVHLLPSNHDIWIIPVSSNLRCIIQDLDGLFLNYGSEMSLTDIHRKALN